MARPRYSLRQLALHALLVTVMLLTTLLTPFSGRRAVAQEPTATPPLPPLTATVPPLPTPGPINPDDLVAPPNNEPPPPVPTVLPYIEPTPPEIIPQAGPAVYTPTTPLTVTLSATLPPQGYVNKFILNWQVEGLAQLDPAPQSLRLELRFAEGATPDGRPHFYDPTTRTLRIEQGVAQGHVPVDVDAARTGPFSVQALVVADALPRGSTGISFGPPRPVGPAGGVVRGFEGRVRVNFPAGVLPSQSNVHVRLPARADQPPHSLLGGAFEVVAFDAATGQPRRHFDAPLTISVAYDEARIDGAEEDLALFYFDEEMGQWRPLPTRVNAEANELTAETDHFTSFDFDLQKWQAARLPTMAEFQVSGFTGAATYSYPIQVPAGPGGLQPSLALSYNSQVVDSASSRTQASWAGMGWSLDVGGIERNLMGTNDDTGDDTFSLTVGGISGMLIPVTGDANTPVGWREFRTQDEGFNRVLCQVRDQWHPNDCVTWEVWDKAGTVYRFGSNFSGGSYALLDSNNCVARDVVWYWPLTTSRNAFGQELSYTYHKEQRSLTDHCNTAYTVDLAIIPKEIIWPHSRYRVRFERTLDRLDYDQSWLDQLSKIFFKKSLLRQIYIEQNADGAGTGNAEYETTIRRYDLSYATTQAGSIFPGVAWKPQGASGPTGFTPTLLSITEWGVGATSALPATSFVYGDGMHLTEARNGYGGKVQFEYDATPWHELAEEKPIEQLACRESIWTWITDWVGQQTSCGADGHLGVVGTATNSEITKQQFYPGAVYRLQTWGFRTIGQNGQNGGTWMALGLADVNEYYLGARAEISDGQLHLLDSYVRLPATVTEAKAAIECDFCGIGGNVVLSHVVTRYRVSAKYLN